MVKQGHTTTLLTHTTVWHRCVVPTPYKCTMATTKHTNNATKAQGVMGCVVAHTRVGDKGGCLVGVSCLTNTTLPTLWLLVGWQAECTHTRQSTTKHEHHAANVVAQTKAKRHQGAHTTHHQLVLLQCITHHHHHGCTALHCTK